MCPYAELIFNKETFVMFTSDVKTKSHINKTTFHVVYNCREYTVENIDIFRSNCVLIDVVSKKGETIRCVYKTVGKGRFIVTNNFNDLDNSDDL